VDRSFVYRKGEQNTSGIVSILNLPGQTRTSGIALNEMARYGEAKPRLTSGGKTVSQKESCQENQNSPVCHTTQHEPEYFRLEL
jgi:hypothetical protein